MDLDSAFSNSSFHEGFAEGMKKRAFMATYRKAVTTIENVDEAARQTSALAKQISQDYARLKLVGALGAGAGAAYAVKKYREKQASRNHRSWKHKDAADYAKTMERILGKPHDESDSMLTWINIEGFKRISIVDESIPHFFPSEHRDFVYSTIQVNVPTELHSAFSKVTGSIIIDGLKNEVTARCGGLIKNAVTLGFVEDVLAGKTKPSKEEYAKRINNDIIPDWYKDTMKEK